MGEVIKGGLVVAAGGGEAEVEGQVQVQVARIKRSNNEQK